MDYFEVTVSRLNNSEAGPSTPPDAKYQYQRALALSKTLGGNIYIYSNDQLKYLQAQSVIAYVFLPSYSFEKASNFIVISQKASETAQSITAIASSSISTAQTRIHGLSDNMLAELQKLQTPTSQMAASLQCSVQDSATHIQSQIPQIQQAFADLTTSLSSTVQDLSAIVTQKDIPLNEKVSRVSKEVSDRVNPLLEKVLKTASETLARSKAEVESTTSNGTSNEPSEKQ